MQQRGRKSASSLSVVAGMIDGRPKAPDDLTVDQVEVWERTVGNEPVDFFRTAGCQEMLKQYCRHVVSAFGISQLVERIEADGVSFGQLAPYDQLLKMRDRETRAVLMIATKLRLTNQARYQTRAAASAAAKTHDTKLWDRAA